MFLSGQTLIQRIDLISNGKLCTALPLTVPLVKPVLFPGPNQQHSAPPVPAIATGASLPSLPILSPLPPLTFHYHQMVSIPMARSLEDFIRHSLTNTEQCRRTEKCADLLANVLGGYDPVRDNYRLLLETVRTTAIVESSIYRISIGWVIKESAKATAEKEPSQILSRMRFHLCTRRKTVKSSGKLPESVCDPVISEEDPPMLNQGSESWLSDRLAKILTVGRYFMEMDADTTASKETSEWSNIFYDCEEKKWFIAYRALILEPLEEPPPEDISALDDGDVDIDRGIKTWYRVKGLISVHIDVSGTDINQCENPNGSTEEFSTEGPRKEEKTRFERHVYKQQPSKVPLETTSPISPTENAANVQQQIFNKQANTAERSPKWIVLNLYGTNKCHHENSKVCSFVYIFFFFDCFVYSPSCLLA